LVVALRDIVIDPVIAEEIAPRRSAMRGLVPRELISVLIPFQLRQCEVEPDQFPKNRITIEICNVKIM